MSNGMKTLQFMLKTIMLQEYPHLAQSHTISCREIVKKETSIKNIAQTLSEHLNMSESPLGMIDRSDYQDQHGHLYWMFVCWLPSSQYHVQHETKSTSACTAIKPDGIHFSVLHISFCSSLMLNAGTYITLIGLSPAFSFMALT